MILCGERRVIGNEIGQVARMMGDSSSSNNNDNLGGLGAVRAALAGRVHACWDRLDDSVDELVEVHGIELTAIIARLDTLRSDRDEARGAEPQLG
jgi:hypothetical protein